MDIRLDLLQRDADSHERAIAGKIMPLCRQGERHEPTARELGLTCGARCSQSNLGPEVA
jgi:hypothetical protein